MAGSHANVYDSWQGRLNRKKWYQDPTAKADIIAPKPSIDKSGVPNWPGYETDQIGSMADRELRGQVPPDPSSPELGPQDDWYTRLQGQEGLPSDEILRGYLETPVPDISVKRTAGPRGGGKPYIYSPPSSIQDRFPGYQSKVEPGWSEAANRPKGRGGLTKRSVTELRKRKGELESKLEGGPGYEEFDAPEYDEGKVRKLAQQYGAPDRRLLRESIAQTAAQDFENPNVRRVVLRDALTGYGRGLGQLSQAALRSAAQQYQGEYDREYQERLANWEMANRAAEAEYKRIWDEYESLGGEGGIEPLRSVSDMYDPNLKKG